MVSFTTEGLVELWNRPLRRGCCPLLFPQCRLSHNCSIINTQDILPRANFIREWHRLLSRISWGRDSRQAETITMRCRCLVDGEQMLCTLLIPVCKEAYTCQTVSICNFSFWMSVWMFLTDEQMCRSWFHRALSVDIQHLIKKIAMWTCFSICMGKYSPMIVHNK